MHFDEVAIIGAGLSGLSLAIFLKQRNIQCTIYELRPSNVAAAGALMLSPNALRSLDAIGLYDRIKMEGWHFRAGSFRNNQYEFIDSYEFGNAEKYGYDCLRLYRQVLSDQLRAMVRDCNIEIVNEKVFSHIVSEDGSGATFAFADGEQRRAGIIVGADGIRSAVRKYIFPEVEPTFANVMTIVCAVPTSLVKFPSDNYGLPVLINGEAGSFSLAQQNADGSEMLAAMQVRTHERDKAGWKALNEDKHQLLDMLRQNYETWNETIKSAIDAINPETLFIWPFYAVPRLPHWTSTQGRVVLLGDAAHVSNYLLLKPTIYTKQYRLFPLLLAKVPTKHLKTSTRSRF
jgi:2-polyprenyl-6-methoxyphenol hydroxylase-like FAD-dependent oxidoreductase